jgi:ABC-type uncharacterized transport system permease subunit
MDSLIIVQGIIITATFSFLTFGIIIQITLKVPKYLLNTIPYALISIAEVFSRFKKNKLLNLKMLYWIPRTKRRMN